MSISSVLLAPNEHLKAWYNEKDTRFNFSEASPQLDQETRIRIEQQAQSIACLVEEGRLIKAISHGITRYHFGPHTQTLAERLQAKCEEELKKSHVQHEEEAKATYSGPFADEPSVGEGTAFLVGQQLILTAAHCISDSSLKRVSKIKLASLRVIFGFQMQPSGTVQREFESKDVYHIETVWQYRYEKGVADWALLKLDREVKGRNPLSLAASQTMITSGTKLYMLGHPLGLPLKLTLSGEVQKTNDTFFQAKINAFKGNSGSPVFADDKVGNMIGMLISGNPDNHAVSKNNQGYVIQIAKTSQKEIDDNGYEKCHKISIGFLKTVLSSSFAMAYFHFSGRTEYLNELKYLTAFGAQSTQVHNLYGPIGIGKSELAHAFINQNIESFSFIWSISCRTKEEQRIGYQRLAQRFQILVEENETSNNLIDRVHRKLEEQNESKPWLLILDDLNAPELSKFPPLPNRGGSILITTYKSLNVQSLLPGVVKATEILPLEPMEALQFLKSITKQSITDSTKLEFQRILKSIAPVKIELEIARLLVKEGDWDLETTKNWTETIEKAANWASLAKFFVKAKAANFDSLKRTYHDHLGKEIACLLSKLGSWEYTNSRYAQALAYHEEALKIQKTVLKNFDSFVMTSLNNIAVCYKSQGNYNKMRKIYDEALKIYYEMLKIKEAKLGKNHTNVADCLNKIGICYQSQRNYNKALKVYNEALKIRRVDLREDHLDIAMSLNNIGLCHGSQRNYKKALEAHKEAFKIRKTALGKNHPDIAVSLNNIGLCHNSQGNYGEALNAYNEALEIRKTTLENHPDVAIYLHNIGICYERQEKYNKALKAHDEALKIRKAALGEAHPHVAASLTWIAFCYDSQKNYNKASEAQYKAYEIYKKALGEKHPKVTRTLNNITNRHINEMIKNPQKILNRIFGCCDDTYENPQD